MEERRVHKFINKVKDKFIKQKPVNGNTYEYAFSNEEIESISKQNKQKIIELKQNIIPKKKDNKPNTDEVLSKIETLIESDNEVTEPIDNLKEETIQEEDIVEENTYVDDNKIEELVSDIEPQPKTSFINLNPEHQKLVMDKWNEIKNSQIDKDIIDGKDLLNHNYTITYADEAAKFIHYIRKEYEVVICYLIGFNNEKQGIMNKTIFSDKIDNEWKHLNSYIKMLEKIRKNK